MNTLKLSLEYYQWKLVEGIFHDFCQQLCSYSEKNHKAVYEIRNIFERFLTSHHNSIYLENSENEDVDESIYSERARLSTDLPYIKKMVEELFQKRKFFKNGYQLRKVDFKNKIDGILIRTWNKTYPVDQSDSDLDQPIDFGQDFIKFGHNGEVYQKVSHTSLEKLKIGIENNKWTENDLKKVILRYKANLIGSQQWGIPVAVYESLYAKFGARYEAFASPLNARFLGMEGGAFCSLFPDTDKVFGSLGSFFMVDLLDPMGLGLGSKRVVWSINPPFIESIMEDTFRKVFKAVEQARDLGIELVVFGIMPGWYDCRAFLNLKSFYGLKWIEILKSNEHFYEADKQIIARFESVAYVIDSLPRDEINPQYCSAFNEMKIIEN